MGMHSGAELSWASEAPIANRSDVSVAQIFHGYPLKVRVSVIEFVVKLVRSQVFCPVSGTPRTNLL